MRTKKKKYRIKARFFVILIVGISLIGGGIMHFTKDDSQSTMSINLQRNLKIMVAAKGYINNENLVYDSSYFVGGYPPDDIGVCTDVVWKGFNGINVSLKDLVDKDISENFKAYSSVISVADPNINFRYVPVLEIFLQRNAQVLSTNIRNLLIWQPGDIVTFESSHVAIVSNLHNIWGQPYIIQHGHDPAGDEDRIFATDGMEISGHFRWR